MIWKEPRDWQVHKEICYDFMNYKGEDTCMRAENHMQACSFASCPTYKSGRVATPKLCEWKCRSCMISRTGSEMIYNDTFIKDNLSDVLFRIVDNNSSTLKMSEVRLV